MSEKPTKKFDVTAETPLSLAEENTENVAQELDVLINSAVESQANKSSLSGEEKSDLKKHIYEIVSNYRGEFPSAIMELAPAMRSLMELIITIRQSDIVFNVPNYRQAAYRAADLIYALNKLKTKELDTSSTLLPQLISYMTNTIRHAEATMLGQAHDGELVSEIRDNNQARAYINDPTEYFSRAALAVLTSQEVEDQPN